VDGTSYALIAILLLQVASVVWTMILGRIIIARFQQELHLLDQSIAEALTSTLESLPMEGVEFNPIGGAIAQWISSLAESKANTFEAQITPIRADDGKFAKDDQVQPDFRIPEV
jgi:hypothetical protein